MKRSGPYKQTSHPSRLSEGVAALRQDAVVERTRVRHVSQAQSATSTTSIKTLPIDIPWQPGFANWLGWLRDGYMLEWDMLTRPTSNIVPVHGALCGFNLQRSLPYFTIGQLMGYSSSLRDKNCKAEYRQKKDEGTVDGWRRWMHAGSCSHNTVCPSRTEIGSAV